MGKHHSEVVAQLGLQSLQRVSGGCAEVVARRRDLTPEEFRNEYMWPNKPVIVELGLCQDWGCVMWNRSDGAPNVTYLREAYGESPVPVVLQHGEGHEERVVTKLQSFLDYWEARSAGQEGACIPGVSPCRTAYLKDWHFHRQFPDDNAYCVPNLFADDWLNEWCDGCAGDDYRFVYMGPKGSFTPLHQDVLCSFSWSLNVTGSKLWLLYPPSQTHLLMNRFGSPPTDVRYVDAAEFPNFASAVALRAIQLSGEVIFVPSGWYHQVENLDETISINHNWFNAANIDLVAESLLGDYHRIVENLEDCRTMEGFELQCQRILQANNGTTLPELYSLLSKLAVSHSADLDRLDAASHSAAEQIQLMLSASKLLDALQTLVETSCVQCFLEHGPSLDENMQQPTCRGTPLSQTSAVGSLSHSTDRLTAVG